MIFCMPFEQKLVILPFQRIQLTDTESHRVYGTVEVEFLEVIVGVHGYGDHHLICLLYKD